MNELRRIGSFAKSVTRKNRDKFSSADVYSVTKYDGFVRSLSYFKKQVFSRDLSTYKIVRKGEFAYSTIHLDEGAIGLLKEGEALISPMYTVFKVDKSVDIFYLDHLLSSDLLLNKYGLIGQGSVNRRKSIPFSTFAALEVRIPPLLEQKKIVSILNSVDAVIEYTEKKIDKLKNLKEATINELLTKGINHKEFKQTALGRVPEGWEVKPLSKVCEVSSSKRVMQSDYVKEGVPFYRSKEIILKSKGKKVDSILYISEDQFMNLASKFGAPASGDILITAVGTIGVCYLVDQEKFYFKDGNLLWLKNITSLLPSFLSVYLSNQITRERIIDISGGSSQSALTIEKLSEFLVLIPSSYEQEKFSRISNSFDGLIDSQRQKLIQTKSLKKSLMQDLISGLKRVNI